MSIPDSAIDEIRQRANIAEVAAEFVELKRSGRTLTGCCPFHQEKTPSFHVHEEEGFFKCFGCGKKGDVFSLLMEMRNWTFPEAVQFLAARYGVRLPEKSINQPKRDHTAQLRKLATAVAQTYQAFLRDENLGRSSRKYLKSRDFTGETCKEFGVGYAPENLETFLGGLKKQIKELSDEQLLLGLETLGILRTSDPKKGGKKYLMFRDRLIFPIMRSDGCPIAFGGRILKALDKVPKYINSPETPIYLKRRTLYGLSQATAALRVNRRALIVEGYTDVIALHQAGIQNVLATCGTAVTEEHASVLRRVADSAVVVFDGDAAGRSSAARCFERFLNSGVELKVLFLPQGEDPDSLVRKIGAQKFLKRIEDEACSALSAFLDCSLESNKDEGIVHKAKVAKDATRLLAKVSNPVEQELLIQAAAEHLGVEVASLLKLLNQSRSSSRAVSSHQSAKHSTQAQAFSAGSAPRAQRSNTSFSSRATPDVAQPVQSVSKKRSQVGAYLEQLLVAVVCEPQLASGIAEIPSLLESSKIGPDRVDAISMLFDLIRSDQAPSSLSLAQEAGELEQVSESWRVVLAKCGIESERIISEAIRQSRVGGSRLDELVSAASTVSARSTMIEELQILRTAEANAGDSKDKLKLAQQKLKARREMDKLSSVSAHGLIKK